MPISRRDRPSNSQNELIDRLANPRTPSDLFLALQNPVTPAYKKMMKMINDEIELSLIIEFLIERFIMQSYTAEQKEKENILNDMLARELDEKTKEQHLYFNLSGQKTPEALLKFNAAELKERLDGRQHLIDTLAMNCSDLRQTINQLHQGMSENTSHWTRVVAQAQASHYAERLIENNVRFVTSSGREIDPSSHQGRTIIDRVFSMPPPIQLLNIIHDSHQRSSLNSNNDTRPNQSVDTHDNERIAAPLSPPELVNVALPSGAREMTQQSFVINELNLIVACAEGESVTDIVKSLNNNREARQYLPGVELMPAFTVPTSHYSSVAKRTDGMARYIKSVLENESELNNERVKNINDKMMPNLTAAQAKASFKNIFDELNEINDGAIGSDLLRAIKQNKDMLSSVKPGVVKPVVAGPSMPRSKPVNRNVSKEVDERAQLFTHAIRLKSDEVEAKSELLLNELKLKKEQSRQVLEMKLYTEKTGHEYVGPSHAEVKTSQTPSLRRSKEDHS